MKVAKIRCKSCGNGTVESLPYELTDSHCKKCDSWITMEIYDFEEVE